MPGSICGRFRAGFFRDRHRPGWDWVLHGQRERSGGGQWVIQLLPWPCVWTIESLWDTGAQAHISTYSQGQKGRSVFSFLFVSFYSFMYLFLRFMCWHVHFTFFRSVLWSEVVTSQTALASTTTATQLVRYLFKAEKTQVDSFQTAHAVSIGRLTPTKTATFTWCEKMKGC